MTKTGLEFGILVIVICPSTWLRVVSLSNHLIFDICDLGFFSHFSRLLQGGKSIEAPFVAVRSRVLCASFTYLPPLYKQLTLTLYTQTGKNRCARVIVPPVAGRACSPRTGSHVRSSTLHPLPACARPHLAHSDAFSSAWVYNVKVNSSFGLWYNESQSVGKGF